MALRKLSFEVQSKFRASTQIRSFKTAIEELVYNSLDANSSSIAIRVNVKDNYIQVVDNGHGVAKDDFNILGQRYTTSKYENSTTETMYGCYGQSLANIIEVSQSVKIISKSINNMETWMKCFCNGQEELCSVIAERPSAGTTVEVKGFLYNLTILKKAVKAMQELQNIKTFLEQMSLIHCNTSISLRDNSENEIIFKIHKNRDIIQTLSSVLSVSVTNLQEFQVEKSQYKVTGLIQTNNEEVKGHQWIYINGRIIENSNLHKIVNENLAKGGISYKNEGEKVASNDELPDYFIFVKCPKNAYDIISNPKESILEFKNFIHINKLLEKLVKFRMGEMQIVKKKTTIQPVDTPEDKKAHDTDTRNKVKQIMQKILGSQRKKLDGSNLRNGVKGKIMKRRENKKAPNGDNINQEQKCEIQNVTNVEYHAPTNKHGVSNGLRTYLQVPAIKPMTNKRFASPNPQQQKSTNKRRLSVSVNIPKSKNKNIIKQPVLSKFEKKAADVYKRCNILAKKVDHLLGVNKKRKCRMFTNETIQYSNIFINNKSISVRKKIKELIVHEYVPKRLKIKKDKYDRDIKKSNDLLRPVMNIINRNCFSNNINRAKLVQPQPDPNHLQVNDENVKDIPGPTYESHGYLKDSQMPRPQVNLVEAYKKYQFTTKNFQENLASRIEDRYSNTKQDETEMLHHYKIFDRTFTDAATSSYSMHFNKTDSQINKKHNTQVNESDVILCSNNDICIGSTYTIAESQIPNSRHLKTISARTSIIDTAGTDNHDMTISRVGDVNFYSEQSSHAKSTHKNTPVTFEKPDVDVVFISNSQFSNTGSNFIDPFKLCEAVIGCHSEQDCEKMIENTFIFDSINDVMESKIHYKIQSEDCLELDATRICRKLEEDYRSNNIYLRNKIKDCEPDLNSNKENCFNLKNRRRYIPKGMSPIFENCNLKDVCDYELVDDYFEENVYNNFAQNVQIHSEMFEPKIQNVKDATAKDVQKVDIKLNIDNACLKFNAISLKHAKVLGQVDNKFIATIINGDCNGAHDCLVLFDQHAVHERIRLEQNMSEYVTDEKWKSISVDGFSIKLNRDEILFLHNYRDKFERLGLQWCMASDTQVLVNALPEAILGKHQRQVDVVLKTVKRLIKEEINIIKEQGGCVSLHPKSIMDLVFSEACRYAIMFGTALSARECSELVEALSRCRTPFQCAHGRPALAVLLEVARETRPYTVNLKKVEQFRRRFLNK